MPSPPQFKDNPYYLHGTRPRVKGIVVEVKTNLVSCVIAQVDSQSNQAFFSQFVLKLECFQNSTKSIETEEFSFLENFFSLDARNVFYD